MLSVAPGQDDRLEQMIAIRQQQRAAAASSPAPAASTAAATAARPAGRSGSTGLSSGVLSAMVGLMNTGDETPVPAATGRPTPAQAGGTTTAGLAPLARANAAYASLSTGQSTGARSASTALSA